MSLLQYQPSMDRFLFYLIVKFDKTEQNRNKNQIWQIKFDKTERNRNKNQISSVRTGLIHKSI